MNDAQGLIITRPMQMRDAMLVDTNIPEADYPEYDPDVTYALGDRCITVATHQIWQSAADDNKGNDPLTSPDKWKSPGVTNRWRAFDDAVNTQTVAPPVEDPEDPYEIAYRIRPFAAVTALNILNITNALTVRARMEDPTFGQVYDKSVQMVQPPETPSWWVWSFGGRKVATMAAFDDLPAYVDADLIIEIDGGPALGVGVIMFGQQRSFGIGVQYGARVGMLSHSVRERDEFGALRLRRRLPSKRMNFSLLIGNHELDALNDFLMEIDAIPCLFSAARRHESMNVYGIIGNFDTTISYPDHSVCDIEIEGLQ